MPQLPVDWSSNQGKKPALFGERQGETEFGIVVLNKD